MGKKTSFLETWRWFSRLDSKTRMVEGREPFWRLHCGCSLDVLWQEPDWEANAGVSAFSFLFVWLRRLFPGPVSPQWRVLGYLWCLVVSLKITNTEKKTKNQTNLKTDEEQSTIRLFFQTVRQKRKLSKNEWIFYWYLWKRVALLAWFREDY